MSTPWISACGETGVKTISRTQQHRHFSSLFLSSALDLTFTQTGGSLCYHVGCGLKYSHRKACQHLQNAEEPFPSCWVNELPNPQPHGRLCYESHQLRSIAYTLGMPQAAWPQKNFYHTPFLSSFSPVFFCKSQGMTHPSSYTLDLVAVLASHGPWEVREQNTKFPGYFMPLPKNRRGLFLASQIKNILGTWDSTAWSNKTNIQGKKAKSFHLTS